MESTKAMNIGNKLGLFVMSCSTIFVMSGCMPGSMTEQAVRESAPSIEVTRSTFSQRPNAPAVLTIGDFSESTPYLAICKNFAQLDPTRPFTDDSPTISLDGFGHGSGADTARAQASEVANARLDEYGQWIAEQHGRDMGFHYTSAPACHVQRAQCVIHHDLVTVFAPTIEAAMPHYVSFFDSMGLAPCFECSWQACAS